MKRLHKQYKAIKKFVKQVKKEQIPILIVPKELLHYEKNRTNT